MDFKEFKSKLLEVLSKKYKTDNKIIAENSKIIEGYSEEFELMVGELIKLEVDCENVFKNLLNTIDKELDYTHYACEFSLVYHFLKKFPDNFSYQVPSQIASTGNKCDTKKNYDFKFSNKGINFHVEVKTNKSMDYTNKEPYKFFLSPDETKSMYNQGSKNFSPNLMPKISRFLKDANGQLPVKQSANDINIVILCCNDLDEYADILECLLNTRIGILSEQNKGSNIVPTKEELCNIDGVVICNLGFEHSAIFNREKLFKFYNSYNVCLNGKEIWKYQRSIPVLPIMIDFDRVEANIKEIMAESFFSHTVDLINCLKENNNKFQKAPFDLFNKILKGEI